MSILSIAKKYVARGQAKPAGKIPKTTKVKAGQSVSSEHTGVNLALDLQLRVTEKSILLQEKGYVVFRVTRNANKHQIKQAVKNKFGVKVLAVKTLPVAARLRRRGNTVGKTRLWKKAYVKVDDVQKISVGP